MEKNYSSIFIPQYFSMFPTKRKFALVVLISVCLVLARFANASIYNPIISILAFLMIFWVLGLTSFLKEAIINDVKKRGITEKNRRLYFFLCLILITAIFLANKAGWTWFLGDTLDPATNLFFTFVPVILFLGISGKTNIFFAIILFFMCAIFSMDKFDKTSEIFAILSFFIFTLAVIQITIDTRNFKNVK